MGEGDGPTEGKIAPAAGEIEAGADKGRRNQPFLRRHFEAERKPKPATETTSRISKSEQSRRRRQNSERKSKNRDAFGARHSGERKRRWNETRCGMETAARLLAGDKKIDAEKTAADKN
jgi:hypothetical protein